MLGGFPERREAPPARIVATIDADDYLVEKLVYESFPGYFVSALLYRPKQDQFTAPRHPEPLRPFDDRARPSRPTRSSTSTW